MSAAAAFPSWLMLEPFVFRRDDDESFPDATKAPVRASATTSWGARFLLAFTLAEPPRISRLYAQLPVPGFLDRRVGDPLAILATHRHLALFRVGTRTPTMLIVQNFFIYIAAAGENNNPSSSFSLKALPPCTEPPFDYSPDGDNLQPRRASASPRLLAVKSMGLLCRGDEEFAVAELNLFKPSHSKVFADICFLRSSCAPAVGDHQLLGGTWSSTRVDILCSGGDNPDDDAWQLCCWETDAIVPFRQWLCWIDYYRGILFCDVFRDPTPTVTFLRLPLDKFPYTRIRTDTYSYLYRGASVVGHGRELKFVNVARHDGLGFGALKPGTGFTVTCHTLVLGVAGGNGGGSMWEWEEDYTVTSSQLWGANLPDHLPRDILMFPQVDIDRPHVVHFLYCEFLYAYKKMWVVSIDMSTKAVESFSPYINGHEGLQTDDGELIREKSTAPRPFLPCEFPKFLNVPRKKDME